MENTKKSQPKSAETEGNGRDLYFTVSFMTAMLADVQKIIRTFESQSHYSLTAADRRRKIGSGIRNYGFLDKTSDLAEAFPQYHPPKFDMKEFRELGENVEFCRNLLAMLNEFTRVVSNSLLVYGDEAFRMALRFYGSVQELARGGDEGAVAVFNMLRPYFRRQRIADAPTDHEVETDVHNLLHGIKDGKIVIENEHPHLDGGKHVVVDETHRNRNTVKATIEEENNN